MSGIEETLLLLLDAVNERRLKLDDILARLYTNPCEIFGIQEQPDTRIEVEVERPSAFTKRSYWSPIENRATFGSIHRVIVKGKTMVVDGESLSNGTMGLNVSSVSGSVGKVVPFKSARRSSTDHLNVRPPPGTLGPASSAISAIEAPSSPPTFALTRSPQLGAGSNLAAASAAMPPSNLMSAFQESQPLSLGSAAQQTPLPSLRSLVVNPTFSRRHILSVRQFNRDDLHALFTVAQEMRLMVERNGILDILKGKVLCTLFYEESTRTSCSFEAAMVRCGGQVVTVNTDRSSINKGETLSDTIRTLGCYGDAVILRHPAVGSSQQAAKFSPVPIINAGDGIGEHPTQALLDIFTIREELGTVSGLTVTILGDLKNGRTAHSLVKLLCLYGVTINYVSPSSLAMPEDVKAEAAKRGISQFETSDLNAVIEKTDVLYVTRVQKERFASEAEYDSVKDSYVVNNDLLKRAKDHMIVLHPLPRVNEIDPEVDFDIRRAAYFRQMRYGLFVRMALLAMVLQQSEAR